MTYLHVRWTHAGETDPVEMYAELDADRYEVRKVEVFRDGRVVGVGSAGSTSKSTRLGELPVPPTVEIATDPQFDPREITREQFEAAWRGGRVRERMTAG